MGSAHMAESLALVHQLISLHTISPKLEHSHGGELRPKPVCDDGNEPDTEPKALCYNEHILMPPGLLGCSLRPVTRDLTMSLMHGWR
jgi:hypothetical protein